MTKGVRRRWRKQAARAVLFAAAVLVYMPPVLWSLEGRTDAVMWLFVLTAGALPAAVRLKLRAKGTYASDVYEESKARVASASLLLSQVTERKGKPLIRLGKPLLFRGSGRLFRRSDAGTVLAEMRIKAFLRKLENVRLWFGFFSVSSSAVLLSPGWVALILALLLPLLAAVWAHRHWKDWLQEPFVAQFRWEKTAMRQGASISRFWLIMPGVVILSVLTGFSIGGWLGIAAVPAIWAYWLGLNKLLAEWMAPAPSVQE
ncbi:ABC transporter permease [uncultured Paenibacillus sp.]|uniref:ABC transporter permease n=1 Tax=uncultured Paenibacillus sp. TaxID=227322 RepID=UPI0028D1E16E|nr:ABC transporter permease [uncultured Paenibacillus sp.]